MDSAECPAGIEDVAEAYLMGALPRHQAITFEDNYVACDECATILYKTAEYIDAMRAAAKKVRSASATHVK